MANRLPSPPGCAVSHDIFIQGHKQFTGAYKPRKKVCSGFPPCTRCQRDGFVCTTENAAKNDFRRLSPEYTEVFQKRHSALKATIRSLYLMVRNGDTWEFDEPELDDRGELMIHDIVHKLGHDLPCTEAESPTPPANFKDEARSKESTSQHKKEIKEQVVKEKTVVLDAGLPTPCQAEQSPPELHVDAFTDDSKASIDRWVGSETLNTSPQHWVDGFYMDFSAPIWGADMMTLHWPQSDFISEASGESVLANMPLLFQPLDFNITGKS
ncbi:zinc cluster transcription factor [Fusarium phyllophilum]|uniref:Zinc cluster transcription factor n=1 Tax=Fusarium phyllophilum TaxID=47803 RepID=A0A8H5NBV5_9HYPO|nr:zinc cluster transcription factor [Fusarium phyllophilum]